MPPCRPPPRRGCPSGSASARSASATAPWLGLPDLGDGESFEDLLSALVDPAPAAVTVMHAKPEVTLDAIEIIRRHFAGPVGVYAENGDWQPPNWVFDGLTPAGYLEQAITWADHGAQLIGGCCGVGPEHIRVLADGLAGRGQPA